MDGKYCFVAFTSVLGITLAMVRDLDLKPGALCWGFGMKGQPLIAVYDQTQQTLCPDELLSLVLLKASMS